MRTSRALFLVASVALVAQHLFVIRSRHVRYLESQLAPYGSAMPGKDFGAYMLLSLPGVVRMFTTGTLRAPDHAATLEGYHSQLQFNPFGGSNKAALHESEYFAENYYFWASLPGASTDFILTTRLSFYGRNASHVVPWFTFSYKGESWNLPDEFEHECAPHALTDPRVASAPGLGELYFELVEPLKHWRLKYSGLVQNEKTRAREHVDAEFDIEFRDTDPFLYQLMWDEMTAALSMASVPWTSQFFANLRAQNQERYASRSKRASGKIAFKSRAEIVLPQLLSSRDHNWGIRKWSFIYRYLWWPPIHFATPVQIEGVNYTSFTGSWVEYGNTFSDMIVGGLMSDDGACAAFSGATPLRTIVPEWFKAKSQRGKGIGEALVPATQSMTLGLLQSTYALDIRVTKRGTKSNLWAHSFLLADGTFEIHEAQALLEFSLRKMGSEEVLMTSTAQGLWEFGASLEDGKAQGG
jgi:hypothetical protein